MGWLQNLLRTEAEDWYFGGLPVPGAARSMVAKDSAYLSVYVEAVHIGNARVRAQKFFGSVTSWCTLSSRSGTPVEQVVVSTPRRLQGADPDNLDLVVTGTTPLLREVPYRGGGLSLEIGLFAVPSANLVGPYLELLEDITSVAGVNPGQALLAPVRKGLDMLLGATADASLEIGLAHTWAVPETGYFAVARVPAKTEGLALGQGNRLLDATGAPVRAPYLILRVERTSERADWHSIQALRDMYEQVRDAVRRGDRAEALAAQAILRRIAVFSDDLLVEDGERLADMVEGMVAKAFPEGAPARGAEPYTMPDLAALPLYPR